MPGSQRIIVAEAEKGIIKNSVAPMSALQLSAASSPVQEWTTPLFAEKNVRVFVKRDDLLHPYISGNKWRKLSPILASASRDKKTRLVTFGGAWSNHLVAVACAGATYGFKTTGFVRGEQVMNLALTLSSLFGMDLVFVSRDSYRDKQALFDQTFGDDATALFINEGGAGAEGAAGAASVIDELEEDYDHIFCAAGTGTTAAGLLNGIVANRKRMHLHAVQVLKGEDFLRDEISKLGPKGAEFTLHTSYHFGGYAKTTPDLIDLIRTVAAGTGILTDPVYTGKMMFAAFDLVKNGYFKKGDRILLLHTGGLIGIAGKMEEMLDDRC